MSELTSMVRDCHSRSRQLCFRAAGHSFHDQALNDDLVISLAGLDRILDLDPVARTITVEPGVTWGRIVDAALAHDMVPYVVVTTEEATAGGTLASDGLSRHSPAYGTESAHVLSLDLLAPTFDEPVRLPQPDHEDISREAQWYRAVIGGFGYLGAVTQITYRLLSLRDLRGPSGEAHGPIQVATELTAVEGFDALISEQLRPTRELVRDRGDLETWDFSRDVTGAESAVYSISFLHEGNGRGAVYRSAYTRGESPRPYFVFDLQSPVRKWVDLLATNTAVRRVGRRVAWELIRYDSRRKTRFINDVRDFLFFMDANVAAKRLAEGAGFSMPVVQQTFVVPVDRTAAFLDEIPEMLAARRVLPTLFDVLYMPRDRILMSASHALEGFACTLAFEDIRRPATRGRVIDVLRDISKLCLRYGGRVHLTKNVYADMEVLGAMYGPQLEVFLSHKRRLDPRGILRNPFFERVFLAASSMR